MLTGGLPLSKTMTTIEPRICGAFFLRSVEHRSASFTLNPLTMRSSHGAMSLIV